MINITNIITCKICGTKLSVLGMPRHLKTKHLDIQNTKDYYDKYIKSDNDGICLICRKPTKFSGLTKGYNQYCSKYCANHSELRIKHIADTNKDKYGCECVLGNKEIIEKRNQTCIERYGSANVFSSEYGKQKIKDTNLKKYGTEHASQSDIVKQKMKTTCQEKYGVDYVFQSDNFKEKSKQTCLNKYGVEHTFQSKEIQQKIISDYCDKNNVIPLNSLMLYAPNKCCEHFGIKIYTYKKQNFISKYTNIEQLVSYSRDLEKQSGTLFEKELEEFIKSLNIDYIMRSYKIIPPMQLDCYIPSKNVAVEINGNYWHSINNGVNKEYHLRKTELCQGQNIRLIHIFEYEWNNKKDICKSIIASSLNIYKQRIYARNCTIKEVNNKDTKQFLNNNHIQGSINSLYNLGLYYNNELVQLITIGKSRFKKDEYELLRMCTKLNTQVIGGFSKLLKHQPYNELISYIDRSKFTGVSYNEIGFTQLSITKPNYFYILNNTKLSRLSTQKHKLPKLLGDKFDFNKTEQQNMMDAGYLLLYDCGNYKVKYTKSI